MLCYRCVYPLPAHKRLLSLAKSTTRNQSHFVRSYAVKLKKALLAAVGGALLLGAATANAADNELKVWCWDDNFNVPAARLAAEHYQAKHPEVTIKVESIAQDDLMQRLNAALGANNTRSLPDVVLIEDYRVQNFLIGYPNFLRDITKDIDLSNFVDYKVKASSDAKGQHYGVPFDSGVTATFLRMDMFEKAGYKLEDFQDITWDQFIDMGKKVKEATGAYLIGYDPNDMFLLHAMMQSAGVWYTNPDATKVTVANNPALKEGLRLLKRLQDEGLVFYYQGWMPLLASFQQGHVASIVQGCWLTPTVEADKEKAGLWRLAPIPKLSNVEGATHYSNLGGSQWYVNAQSAQSDLAVDFLKETFASDAELINELVPKISLVTTWKDTSKLSNYDVSNAFFGDQKIYSLYSQWMQDVPSVNYGPHTRAIESLVTEAVQRVLSGEDIDTVLQETQSNAEMQVGL